MTRKVAAVALTIMLVPAAAQAAPGDQAAHQAGNTAKRKFGNVTPDVWKHSLSRCVSVEGWAYWHCKVHIDGRHGYHGVFRVLVNRESLDAYVRGFEVTA